MNPRIVTNHLDYLTTLHRAETTDWGVLLHVDRELVRLDVLQPGLLRLKISQAQRFDEQPTWAVCASFEAPPEFAVKEDQQAVTVTTDDLTVRFQRQPFAIRVERTDDGSVVMETAIDDAGKSLAYGCLNDRFVVTRKRCFGDDFYGLGEKTGPFNRDGHDYTLWNTDILAPDVDKNIIRRRDTSNPKDDPTSTVFDPYYMSIPFFYHADPKAPGQPMAGFFIDNSYRAEFEFSQPNAYRFQFSGGQYTEYIMAGPEMASVLRDYTALTGRMQRPPIWALGYHQCRWHKYSQEQTLALAERFRQARIPCDTLWLDIDYMDGYRVFTWNRDLFPDPTAMLDALREQGFRVITIIDPGVKAEPGYIVFDEGNEQGLFCKTDGGGLYIGQVWPGRTAFPDFSQEAGRQWWGRLNAAHVKSGLAGIWNDMNEPATGAVDPMAMRFDRDGANWPHERIHNQYALLMAMGTVEGLQAALPGQRTFVLSRAGFSGIQRYAANWMGDNFSRWDHLDMALPMAMGLGVSGQPFVGADIGGFAGETNPELLIRWTQHAVLTPFCRNHNSSRQDQYPWTFGEAAQEVIGNAIAQRYRLMPYIYTAFAQSAADGRPVQRHLLVDYQHDVACRHVDDQYLLGNDLLVAPILKAGQTSRNVYFPEGDWFDFFRGEWYEGPRYVTVDAPLNVMPVFFKAGAVIPTWPDIPPSTMGYYPESINLLVFVPECDGEYRSELIEDDGLTHAFEEGKYLRTRFTLTRELDELTLKADVTGDGFPEFQRSQFTVVFLGADVDEAKLGRKALRIQGNYVEFANRGKPFTLTVTVE